MILLTQFEPASRVEKVKVFKAEGGKAKGCPGQGRSDEPSRRSKTFNRSITELTKSSFAGVVRKIV
ncbi:hypothetical protein RUM44_010722 [Polyplax serrata]